MVWYRTYVRMIRVLGTFLRITFFGEPRSTTYTGYTPAVRVYNSWYQIFHTAVVPVYVLLLLYGTSVHRSAVVVVSSNNQEETDHFLAPAAHGQAVHLEPWTTYSVRANLGQRVLGCGRWVGLLLR